MSPLRLFAVLSAAAALAACGSLNLGVSVPVGPHTGVGVSVGTDGRVGVGIGVSASGGQVGVSTSGRLPKAEPEQEQQK